MYLRIHIDKDWDVGEFEQYFHCIGEYYDFVFSSRTIFAFDDGRAIHRVSARLLELSRMRVRTIRFGSKGFTDLIGFGEALKEIRELIQFLIVHWREREDRDLERKMKHAELLKAELALIEEFDRIQRDRDRDGTTRRFDISALMSKFSALPDLTALNEAIRDGRIVGADLLDGDGEED